MLGVIFLITYLLAGCFILRCLLPERSPLARLWLGLCLGLLLLMWLPALMAFALTFSLAAHYASLGILCLLCLGCFFARDPRAAKPWDQAETALLYQCLLIALPLTVLGGYLQYTHNLRIGADGSYYVGQSTYGDLALHTSIITSLPSASFPPEYSILPGERLSYPFLVDGLSASLYLGGWSLQSSLVIPGTGMMALCYIGFLVLARELTGGKKAAMLACLLFFLNGGLGFLYAFDQSAGEVGERITTILEGFYLTPTNQPEPNNLRWSNVICDLMVPQRTLLGGWCLVIPCFYLLFTSLEEKKLRPLLLLGVWGGGLPMIHTHSFTALALCSLGVMGYDLCHSPNRWQTFRPYLIYGVIAACLALPQLFLWTFQQAGGSDHFLTLQFNWVNNPGGMGMRDLYLWFYIKNIGLPVLLLICALVEKNKAHRRIAAGAFLIFLAAEFIRFQPNEYDNNKLFYLWYLLCCMLIADYCALLWQRLWGLRGRWVLGGFAAVCFFLSAGLTVAREWVSDYQVYTPQDVACAQFIKEHTPAQSVFITGTQHLNVVSSLSGRTIVCGPSLWLHWHGFNTLQREAQLAAFYADPAGNQALAAAYGADYVYVSYNELANYSVDLAALDGLYTKIYDDGVNRIYQIPKEAVAG